MFKSAHVESWDPFAEVEENSPEEAAFVEQSHNLTGEVRESVSRSIRRTFPRPVVVLLEAAVTWLSGCPHRGQRPLVERGRVAYTVEALAGFALAVVLGHLAVVNGLWLSLPILWLVLVGRAWAMFNIFHHATHDTLFRSKRLNRVLASCISVVSFSSSLDSYRKEHIQSHHTRAMCTYSDKEAVFIPLGFSPGKSKEYYYRRLAWLILTPWTYLRYAKYRLWDWQKQESWPRRLAVWAYVIALVGVAYRFHLMESLLWAYGFPLFVVFNVSGLLGTFSEHHWGTLLDKPARLRLVLLQQSRFLLDPAPDCGLPMRRRVAAWLLWWLRLLCYHLPVRIAVLPGDSMHHDHHHRHPRTEKWTSSTYERFDHLQNGCPGFRDYPHTHAWSLGEAIDRVFTRMSAAPRPDATAPRCDDPLSRPGRGFWSRVRR